LVDIIIYYNSSERLPVFPLLYTPTLAAIPLTLCRVVDILPFETLEICPAWPAPYMSPPFPGSPFFSTVKYPPPGLVYFTPLYVKVCPPIYAAPLFFVSFQVADLCMGLRWSFSPFLIFSGFAWYGPPLLIPHLLFCLPFRFYLHCL